MTTKSRPRHPHSKTPLEKARDKQLVFRYANVYYVYSPLVSKQIPLGLVGEEDAINTYIRNNPATWRRV